MTESPISPNEPPESLGPAEIPSSQPSRFFVVSRLARLCRKELREILRDRRTIVTLVLMPLLLYPVLSLIFNKLLVSQFNPSTAPIDILVGFESELQANEFMSLVREGEAALSAMGIAVDPETSPQFKLVEAKEAEIAVKDGIIDVGIFQNDPQPGAEEETSNPLQNNSKWELLYRPNSLLGDQAASYFEDRLNALNNGLTLQLLKMRGLPEKLPATFEIRTLDEEVAAAVSLASFIPLMLILMTITGAVYPAIDLTAGERERGTMEALIAAPIPRLGLLLAKYVAVVFVALLTAAANLVAMTVTLSVTGLEELVFGPDGISVGVLFQIFGLLILFSAFFSAILLAITSFARSFKEAQAYLIPLMLLALGPGVISLSPEIELTPSWAVTPLVNIVLLARDILAQKFNPIMSFLVIQATILYAVAALTVAARVFGTDAILYGSQKGWRDFLKRPAEAQKTASISMAFFCLSLLFLTLFYSLGLLSQFSDQTMGILALAYMVVSIIIFVGIPSLLARQGHIRFRTGFALRRAKLLHWLAALFLGLSLWTLCHELVLLSQWLGWVSLDEKKLSADSLVEQWRTVPAILVVLAWGITPAVVEEYFFRGFLLRSLLSRLNAKNAILISAIVFGAFHVVGANLLTPERFLPSTLMGLALGILAWRSNSTLPGILLHAVNNSSLLLVAYYEDQLSDLGIGIEETNHLPLHWFAIAAVALAIGWGLVAFVKPDESE
ncbi:MAG: ABC transporter permease subunit/CPBP intramembrane protease [Planctomycetota bacterium]|nr:ABC transporter permease subunit/CPBP intramembrane protease [Planctomycetota bacterium]